LDWVTGRDLAQACRDYYKKPAAIALWLLCEIAIIACDLAEVIGSAIALELLFRIPLVAGILITGFDVLLILALGQFGFRKLEAVVITLVATVAGCFALEMVMAKPDWVAVTRGLFTPAFPEPFSGEGGSLLIALGILGATVMPHNLYLHSSIVQTRAHDPSKDGLKQAIRYNTLDTILALGAAFFVNAAILVLAGTVFHGQGQEVDRLEQAHELLRPLLGGAASTAFAVALLASGQSSTITGTLGWSDRHGRFSANPYRSLAAKANNAQSRNRPRDRLDRHLRQRKDARSSGLFAGRAFDAAFVCDLSAPDVHVGQETDG
jgi:manganese transport protein